MPDPDWSLCSVVDGAEGSGPRDRCSRGPRTLAARRLATCGSPFCTSPRGHTKASSRRHPGGLPPWMEPGLPSQPGTGPRQLPGPASFQIGISMRYNHRGPVLSIFLSFFSFLPSIFFFLFFSPSLCPQKKIFLCVPLSPRKKKLPVFCMRSYLMDIQTY